MIVIQSFHAINGCCTQQFLLVTDMIPLRLTYFIMPTGPRILPLHPHHRGMTPKKGVLGMTLNYILWHTKCNGYCYWKWNWYQSSKP